MNLLVISRIKYKRHKLFFEELKRYIDFTFHNPDEENHKEFLNKIKNNKIDFILDNHCYKTLLLPEFKGKKILIMGDLHKTFTRVDGFNKVKFGNPDSLLNAVNKIDYDLVLMIVTDFYSKGKPLDFFTRNLKSAPQLLLLSVPDDYFTFQREKSNDIAFLGVKSKKSYPLRYAIKRDIGKFCRDSGFTLRCDRKKKLRGDYYLKVLQDSKILLFCSSKYKYPVAKYLEAMATGTLIIADEPLHAKEVGLVDGETFVEININNWKEKVTYYLNNNKERERIINNAYSLFKSKHTDKIRVQELLAIIKSI